MNYLGNYRRNTTNSTLKSSKILHKINKNHPKFQTTSLKSVIPLYKFIILLQNVKLEHHHLILFLYIFTLVPLYLNPIAFYYWSHDFVS